jgi:hypothetical protein
MGVRMVLTGHYAGNTMSIAGAKFEKGECYLPGPLANWDPLIRILATYNAWPKGSEEYMLAMKRDEENGIGNFALGKERPSNNSGVDSDESESDEGEGNPDAPSLDDAGGLVSRGSGPEGGSSNPEPDALADQARSKLAKVVADLDPDNDEHWTAAGLPKLQVIEEGLSSGAVSRKDVEAVAPGYDRDSARAKNI